MVAIASDDFARLSATDIAPVLLNFVGKGTSASLGGVIGLGNRGAGGANSVLMGEVVVARGSGKAVKPGTGKLKAF